MQDETVSPGTAETPIAPPQPAEDPAHPDPDPDSPREDAKAPRPTPGSAESGGLDES
jgi:hypothetical protein